MTLETCPCGAEPGQPHDACCPRPEHGPMDAAAEREWCRQRSQLEAERRRGPESREPEWDRGMSR